MRIFNRRRNQTAAPAASSAPELSRDQIKRATRTRKTWSLLTSFFLFITVIFLILVEIASTRNTSNINSWYFIRIDLSHIIPNTVPNFTLINTIAQSLGLHDFYQVGLWGFCEGYKAQGVTFCSNPQALYWFNPVEILRNELLAGASINLPADINDILDLIKIASQVMFGFFLTSACLSFVLMFVVPFSVFSRWAALPIAILTFINALLVTVASIIGTAMFIIFRNVIAGVSELNISATIGSYLFGFMWTATAFAIFAWLVQTGLCCCCASRRDVRTGRKRGNEKAYHTDTSGAPVSGAGQGASEKPKRRFRFGRSNA
ncbi:hypothetical protein EJ04DRAFT_481892 [Polyplosphaeria fusca]|uniref:Integral membrane protein n=1 Tax=Polyplosphaeria fusca TaxID=682080 RepID=A0A9P4V9M0_9PLEO|nr:hypothetical protein EJ04DRAFT_481892 [Polyplosphaeria fusca]